MSPICPQVRLHADGPQLSRVVFGAWRLAESGLDAVNLRELVARCVDIGVTSVDHADIYGGYTVETLFGDALAAAPDLRRKLQILTKCGIRLVSPRFPAQAAKDYDSSGAHIRTAVERSLQALRIERIDLLLLHRPDPLMDADDTAAALQALVREGKLAHVGVSNFTPAQFDLLASRLDLPLATNQIELSPLTTDPFTDGTLDHLQRLRVRPMAWSPLAGGKLFDGTEARAQRVRAALRAVGEELGGRAEDQIAFAWLMHHPAGIVPVTGSHRFDRIQAAADAAHLVLSREQWFAVWRAALGGDVA